MASSDKWPFCLQKTCFSTYACHFLPKISDFIYHILTFYYLCIQILCFIMKIKEIVSALERFAPLPLQDGFDNAGLQIGLTDAEATGALLCLDVTEAVLDEAIALGYNLVIAHHPLLFKGYKSITGRDYVERCILKAIKTTLLSMPPIPIWIMPGGE